MKNNDLNLIQSEAPQSTQERHCSSMHAPKQRCAASAQVRQINDCFVRRRLVCTIYFSLLGQVLNTKQLPFKMVFSTPITPLLSAPLAGSFFPVDMILVGLYSSDAGAFLGGWQEQVHCLFPLKKNFDCSGQWSWAPPGSPFCFLHLQRRVTQLPLPTPSLPQAGPAEPCQPRATQKCQL